MKHEKRFTLFLYILSGILLIIPFTFPIGVVVFISAWCQDNNIQ